MRVGEWMAESLITAEAGTTSGEARDLLVTHGIRHLPVVDGSRLAGIVSDRDLARAPASVPLGDVMTRRVVTSPETPVEDAALLLVTHKIGALPVVREGALVGIFTETDALRALVDLLRVQSGARIELAVGAVPDALGRVMRSLRALGEGGARLLSAAETTDRGAPVLVLRIETGRPAAVVAALRRAGFEIRAVPV